MIDVKKKRNFNLRMKKAPFAIFSLVTVLVIASAISVFGFGDTSWVYTEQGALEIAQDVVLFLNFLLFLIAVLMPGAKSERTITAFFTVLSYAFILRELDFEKMGFDENLVWLFHGKGRNISVALLFGIVIMFALANFKANLNKSIDYIKSKRGIILILGGILCVIGGICEKHAGVNGEFFEESFELYGYACITTVAILTLRKFLKCS